MASTAASIAMMSVFMVSRDLGFCLLRLGSEKGADRFEDLWRLHIEPAVVFLADQFVGLEVDGQPPQPNRVPPAVPQRPRELSFALPPPIACKTHELYWMVMRHGLIC